MTTSGLPTYAAIKRQLMALANRLAPGCEPDLLKLIGKLVDAWQAEHSYLPLNGRALKTFATPAASLLIGAPEDLTPLVLQDDRLYFRRLFELETRVAKALYQRHEAIVGVNPGAAKASEPTLPDHQSLSPSQFRAVALALSRGLAIITGGPGTGKTTVIKSIVTRATAMNPGIRIAVTAPTGKATARLESQFQSEDKPLQLMTLHRLLGFRRNGKPHYHSKHPLNLDLVIVDETSMVDLALADALLAALPPNCRLVLVGDPAQLPSVNLGRLLADITLVDEPVLEGAHCQLTENFRFAEDTSIETLAQNLEAFDPESSAKTGIVGVAPDALSDAQLAEVMSPYLKALETSSDPAVLLHNFESARILTPQYHGDFGVYNLNRRIEALLGRAGTRVNEPFYHGRPILIVDNHYQLGLFNGDIGLCLDPSQVSKPNEQNIQTVDKKTSFKVYFPGTEDQPPRSLPVAALPKHETCFAMTVHKAQGSEFDHVCFVLPEAADTTIQNLQSQALVYTAVTRARKHLTLVTTQNVWRTACNRSQSRRSSLPQQLLKLEGRS